MKQRSLEEKKELLNEHFLYEVKMLQDMVAHSLDFIMSNTRDKQFMENVIVEITTLHARNLFEFFYGDKTWKDYATASQFMKEGSDWSKLRPPLTKSLEMLKNRVHVEVAHLTYKRITGKSPEKYWFTMDIRDDLFKVVHIFLDNLDEKYLGKRLKFFQEKSYII